MHIKLDLSFHWLLFCVLFNFEPFVIHCVLSRFFPVVLLLFVIVLTYVPLPSYNLVPAVSHFKDSMLPSTHFKISYEIILDEGLSQFKERSKSAFIMRSPYHRFGGCPPTILRGLPYAKDALSAAAKHPAIQTAHKI